MRKRKILQHAVRMCLLITMLIARWVLPAIAADPPTPVAWTGTITGQAGGEAYIVTLKAAQTVSGKVYDRTYNVYIPDTYKAAANLDSSGHPKPIPMLLYMHGLQGTAHGQLTKSGYWDQATAHNFIIVAPEGYEKSFNALKCCGKAKTLGLPDMELMLKIKEDVFTKVNINSRQVYAAGHSNGAYLAHLLGCAYADIFAAIAPVSGNSPVANTAYYPSSYCTPAREIPIISFMGIGYSSWGIWYGDWYNYLKGINRGSVCSAVLNAYPALNGGCDNRWNVGFQTDFTIWGAKNGGTSYITTKKIGTHTSVVKPAYKTEYTNCQGGSAVIYYHLHAGHETVYADALDDGINIPEIAWDFLSKYSLP